MEEQWCQFPAMVGLWWGAGSLGRGWPTWLHSASFCVYRWLGGLADSMFETLWEDPQEGETRVLQQELGSPAGMTCRARVPGSSGQVWVLRERHVWETEAPICGQQWTEGGVGGWGARGISFVKTQDVAQCMAHDDSSVSIW